jgi:iron(III) transport system permease protein
VLVVTPPLLWLVVAAVRTLNQPARGFLDPTALRMLLRSTELAGLAVLFATVLGVPSGWLTARFRLPGRKLLLALSLFPLLLPTYCATLAWQLLLLREGPLNSTLLRLGWLHRPLSVDGSLPMAAAVLAFAYWPLMAWSTHFAARSVPPMLEDAARLHVPDARAAAWTVRPALTSALPVGALLVFLLALADFGVPNTLAVPVYPVDLVNRFQLDRDPGVVARFAAPLLLLVVPLVFAQLRFLVHTPLAPQSGERVRLLPPGRGQWAGVAWCWLVLGTTFLLPLAVLAAYSMPLTTYQAVFAESTDHFLNTVMSAGSAAVIAALLALTCGWVNVGRRRLGLDLALSLSYALPGSLIGVAMIQVLNRPGLFDWIYTSLWGLVWTYVALFFPFVYKSLQPAWEQVDRELLDDGAVLGASPWTQFATAGWPVARPYAITGGAIVALLAAREIDATALLRIPDGDTIAFRISDYLHYAPGPNVAALSVLLVVLGALVVGSVVYWGLREG